MAPWAVVHVGADAKLLVNDDHSLFQRSELPHFNCHFAKLKIFLLLVQQS